MAKAHVSNAILVVHDFIRETLKESCPNCAIRDALWAVLMDDLQDISAQ